MKSNSVKSLRDTKIGIIGDNIIYNGPIITAYYILPLANYNVTTTNGKIASIDVLTNLLTNLAVNRPGTTFTIQRCSKMIRKQDVYNNLLNTIRIYRPDYDMPEEFTSHISDQYQNYCLLGVDIQQSGVINGEQNTKDIAKDLFNSFTNKLFDIGNDNIDIQRIMSIEENIYSFVRERCARCSRELTFYHYISKLYPSYEISYESNSFFNDDNFNDILGICNQTVEDNFGYFIMHNEGVNFFDFEQQDTYGCILNVRSFPGHIYEQNFPLNYDGIQVNVQTIPKDKAEIKLKRRRSSARYKIEEIGVAGNDDPESLEKAIEQINLSSHGLSLIDAGEMFCNFNAQILVIGKDKEDLDIETTLKISELRDRGLLVAKSLNQATDFINGFVRLQPRKFDHFAELRFPLAFQMNSGSVVGQFDAEGFIGGKKIKLYAPIIGEDE